MDPITVECDRVYTVGHRWQYDRCSVADHRSDPQGLGHRRRELAKAEDRSPSRVRTSGDRSRFTKEAVVDNGEQRSTRRWRQYAGSWPHRSSSANVESLHNIWLVTLTWMRSSTMVTWSTSMLVKLLWRPVLLYSCLIWCLRACSSFNKIYSRQTRRIIKSVTSHSQATLSFKIITSTIAT